MRFLADGPSIPDELLVARDQGRVLFFCGAGVSRAQAGLPGFLGLAERVLQELRALPDSPARKLVDIATRLQGEPIKGVGGILAADRIFGLLERDFALSDIEWAVGQALKPQDDVNLAAHRTLLNLSKTSNGDVRLVTTNFDLLFEAAAPKTQVWTPSQLPDLKRNAGFRGIVHLHGMFKSTYTKPVGGNLVLSSAEFGRAYLAEGWATDFIRAAVARYLIVFVGYTADDPPVQYLLEALNRNPEHKSGGLYAFQEGRENEANALWKQKGVTAIAYPPEDNHAALWQTLTAWSERARNPDRWRERLLQRAQHGPEALHPHERGQVVHIASTADGARSLAEAKKPIPATWICVFDPASRYAPPGKASYDVIDSPDVDPFAGLGLDSDPEPPKAKEHDVYNRRETPEGVIDVLAPRPLDGVHYPATGFRGLDANETAPLPPRLICLAVWFTRVCHEPTLLWWAAGQKGLHPVVLRNVQFEISNRVSSLSPAMKSGWRYLFEAWGSRPETDSTNGYELNQRLDKEGWTASAKRSFAKLLTPVLVVSRPYGVSPPPKKRRIAQRDVLRLDIKYSRDEIPIEIPDEQLRAIIPIQRRLLEEAATLEAEVHPWGVSNIPPIEPDPELPGESSDRTGGINLHILKFAASFRRLSKLDHAAALAEFAAWRRDDDQVFARLRIWAAGIPNLLDNELAGAILTEASDRVFWGDRDQRDLLLVLARRWSDFSPEHRALLENRLSKGLPRKRYYDPKLYPKWRAHSIVERLSWLRSQGCTFGFDVDAKIASAEKLLPEWTADDAARAIESLEGRGGTVHTDLTFAELADVPLDKLIAAGLAARKWRHGSNQHHDPYAGICEKRPLRVLAALLLIAEPSEEAQIAWAQFLQSGLQQRGPRLASLIARRLARLSPKMLASIVVSAAYWLDNVARSLFKIDAEGTRQLFDRLLHAINSNPENALGKSKIDKEQPDWGNVSWNSVVGRLVAVTIADPILTDLPLNTPLPIEWVRRAAALRALPGDLENFALNQFTRVLDWFYAHDPAWTDREILTPIEGGGRSGDAALAGFFGNATVSGNALFSRLKPILMALATGADHRGPRYEQAVSSLCITAWHEKTETGDRFLSDEELRTVLVHCSIPMRTHMLWHVGQWPIEEKLTVLRQVWPLQLAARSPAVSGRLCAIAFDDEENFPALADAILPLISSFGTGNSLLSVVHSDQSRIIESHPEKVLALLWTALSDEDTAWPFDAGVALERLEKAKPILRRDPRFIELKRRKLRGR